jgi:hypothetical protein
MFLTLLMVVRSLLQIPLAEKLRECEVFGVACDEFLNFATENRKEWASKGQTIVASMVQDNQSGQMTHRSP